MLPLIEMMPATMGSPARPLPNAMLTPGPGSRFTDNWELSAARAASVVRFFASEIGIHPGRMSAVGYSEYRPVASNDSEEGRALNRRIEITLLQQQD